MFLRLRKIMIISNRNPKDEDNSSCSSSTPSQVLSFSALSKIRHYLLIIDKIKYDVLFSSVKIKSPAVTWPSSSPQVNSVTFLVAVNRTSSCLMTSETAALKPGVKHNQSGYIHVGKCDFGPLDFKISSMYWNVND